LNVNSGSSVDLNSRTHALVNFNSAIQAQKTNSKNFKGPCNRKVLVIATVAFSVLAYNAFSRAKRNYLNYSINHTARLFIFPIFRGVLIRESALIINLTDKMVHLICIET